MVRALAVAIALLLAACLSEPELKADSEANFNASFASATKILSDVGKEKLDSALRDLVLARVEAQGPAADATPDRLAKDWAANRTALVVKYARDVVDGRSAREIVAIAEKERKRSAETALANHRDQLAKARAALQAIQREAEAPRDRAEAGALLQRIEIGKARFRFEEVGLLEQPTISFSVVNKGSIPIKRIFVHGKVEAPGKDKPLVAANLDYEFPGGLRPGETKELNLTPNMFSEWGTVPTEAVKGATLSLNLVAFEDAADKRYGEIATPREKLEVRKKALEEGIRTLENKINALEAQARGG